MCEMDSLNIHYVAMTRPEQKLIVLCQDVWKDDGKDTISLMHRYCSQLRPRSCSGSASVASERCGAFTLGDDFSNPGSGFGAPASRLRVLTSAFPSWENRVCIASQSDALLSTVDVDSRRYGIVVHELLSRIMTLDDAVPVVSAYCHEHNLPSGDEEAMLSRIVAAINKEENRQFFAPGLRVKCEAAMVVQGKVRRPDRIVFGDGITWVIDFKTGSYSDSRHEKYRLQVSEYAAALTAMGHPNVTPVIIYV